MSDDEFSKRNRQFNLEIESLEVRLANFKEDEKKNKEIGLTVETLRKMIVDELDFADGFDKTIVDSLLDRIEVYKTEDKKVINLKVYFKVINEEMSYRITKKKVTLLFVPKHTYYLYQTEVSISKGGWTQGTEPIHKSIIWKCLYR